MIRTDIYERIEHERRDAALVVCGHANRLKETAPEWHDKRPDADKLARAVLDAITESGTIRDDAQVVSLRVRKRYGQPGVRITLGEDL